LFVPIALTLTFSVRSAREKAVADAASAALVIPQ
jgi:hypothetical protein